MSRHTVRRRQFLSALGVGGALLAGAGPAAATGGPEPLEDPIPEPIATGPPSRAIRLEPVATGLTAPNWGTAIPGAAGRLAVTDQDGTLWAVDVATGEKSVLLDVSGRLVSLGVAGPGSFDERGLLGVAFHPAFPEEGLLYTYTSEPVAGPADFSTMPSGVDPNHQSVVSEWQVPAPADPGSVVDPASRRELLRVDEPQFNHDAGCLAFGPDGNLLGGPRRRRGADDQGVGHVPGGNGQDPGNVLGTILRMDPAGDDGVNGEYGVPADNPFVDRAGFLDEVWAYGFRNPFRFSFDARTGEMYVADVGQNDVEEVNLGVAGGNYGWRIKEGEFCFDPNGSDAGFVYRLSRPSASGLDPEAVHVLANETGTPFGDTGVVLRVRSARPPARNFRAHLTDDQEVPPVATDAQGQARFSFEGGGTELAFRLNVANVGTVTAAHVHCAPDGVNGPVGVTLYDGPPASPDGTLAAGTVTAPDPGNECGWESLADVRRAMDDGYAYVNVHTEANPAGEIRGQVH